MPMRTVAQRDVDKKRMIKLYAQGYSMAHLAAEFNVSIAQVATDMEGLREEWKKANVSLFNAQIDAVLRTVDKLEQEAWKGWERSCANAERTLIKKKKPTRGKNKSRLTVIEQTTTVEGQSGDPAFLAAIDRCVDRRCKILGLYAPEKIAPVQLGSDGEWRPTEQEKREVLEFAFQRAGLHLLTNDTATETNGAAHGQ